LLYRVVRLTDTADASSALLNTVESKPADFFKNAVRHLCLDTYEVNEATRILEICTGVVDLALTSHLAKPELLVNLAKMSLRRLSTSLSDLFDGEIDLTHPSFAHITHLDIFDVNNLVEICDQIPKLPAITHVALDGELVSTGMVETLLVECPRLRLLILLWMRDKPVSYAAAQVPHLRRALRDSTVSHVLGRLGGPSDRTPPSVVPR